MSTLVKCDNCAEVSGLEPLNWWVLDIFGRKVDTTVDRIFENPYHFCSLDCVTEFASSQARAVEEIEISAATDL